MKHATRLRTLGLTPKTHPDDQRSIGDLITRIRRARLNLGPRNVYALLLEECILALTEITIRLAQAEATLAGPRPTVRGFEIRKIDDDQPTEPDLELRPRRDEEQHDGTTENRDGTGPGLERPDDGFEQSL